MRSVPDPKPVRQTDEDYLDYVRGSECWVCPNPAEPHHLTSRGAGGSDYAVAKLCRRHHTEVHKIGQDAFEQKYNINLWKCSHRLLRLYIDDRNIYR